MLRTSSKQLPRPKPTASQLRHLHTWSGHMCLVRLQQFNTCAFTGACLLGVGARAKPANVQVSCYASSGRLPRQHLVWCRLATQVAPTSAHSSRCRSRKSLQSLSRMHGLQSSSAMSSPRAVLPNPSFKPSPNGMSRQPSSAGPAAHFALAVQRAMPSVPA